jgi:chorismate synthase
MSGANTFGERLQMTTFGESHGTALGAVIDGIPAGVKWDQALLVRDLQRRKPGQSKLVTSRSEDDQPEILSGVYEGVTLGTPIAIIVRNHDAKSDDYKEIAKKSRATPTMSGKISSGTVILAAAADHRAVKPSVE